MAMFLVGMLIGVGGSRLATRLMKCRKVVDDANSMDVVASSSCRVAAIRAACRSGCDAVPDPLAELFAGTEAVEKLVRDVAVARLLPNLCRPRWFDICIETAVTTSAIRQVVFLGAGMDARAYYIHALAGCTVYEVDVPEVLKYKERVLAENKRKVPPVLAAKIVRVRTQLGNPAWIQDLIQAGFATDQPALWVLEGLVYYLTDEQAALLMTTIQSHSTPNSILCADMLNDACRPKDPKKLKGDIAKFVATWKFTTNSPEEWLAKLGFNNIIVKQSGNPGVDFDFIDWDVDSMADDLMTLTHRLSRDVEIDSYGRRVKRLLLVEAKLGSPVKG